MTSAEWTFSPEPDSVAAAEIARHRVEIHHRNPHTRGYTIAIDGVDRWHDQPGPLRSVMRAAEIEAHALSQEPRPTARFWDWNIGCDSMSRITVRRGQTVTALSFSDHDDGWSQTVVRWTFDGRTLYRRTDTDGRDCDGRHGRTSHQWCPAADLDADTSGLTGEPRPAWRDGGGEIFDQFAQLANY